MTLLVTSIAVENIAELEARAERAWAGGTDAVELRIDTLWHRFPTGAPDDPAALAAYLKAHNDRTWIVTCRSAAEGGHFRGDVMERVSLLAAVTPGTHAYLDFELADARAASQAQRLIIKRLWDRLSGLSSASTRLESRPRILHRLILSAHDFNPPEGGPTNLAALVDDMAGAANITAAKVAYSVSHICDSFHALDIMHEWGSAVTAIAMGEDGLWTRVLAKKYGAFATYCALNAESATAPGQVTLEEMIQRYRWPAIDASTRVFGVIGDPVAHSMSPLLFNHWFAEAGLNAVYLPLRVRREGESVRGFLDGCRQRPWLDIGGFSVTIPHKAAARHWAGARADSIAGQIGAVNNLVFQGEKVRGHNTDSPAAISSLLDAFGCRRSDLGGLRVDVLGAGGVAQAVLFGLQEFGCEVTIYGRSPEKTHRIADEYGFRKAAWEDRVRRRGEVLINCTSVGMWPDVEASPLPADSLAGCRLVFDLVYNPVETRLLKDAAAAGSKTLSGLDMFVRQAAMQFTLWTGKSPDTQDARDMVAREIERRIAIRP